MAVNRNLSLKTIIMIGLRKLYRASTQVGFRIVEQGLQMWHKMIPDTWTGSNRLPDDSGNSNTAALYTGRGLSFDGVNDSVNIGNVPELDFERTDSFSFSFYFSCNNRSGYDFLLGKYFAPKGYGVLVNALTGGISVLIRNSVSLNEIFITTNVQNLDDGILRHLVVTYDGSSDASNIRIYINGVASAITIISNNLSQTINNTGSFNLGTYGPGQYLSGRLSNVKVFDIELTSSQVAELYANPEQVLPTGVTESNLVGWWPLADGSTPGIALDASGNGNHGTIAGATVSFALPSPVSQVALKGNNQPMYFDNVNDHINFGDVLDVGTSDFTLLGWILPTSISGDNTILAKYDNNQNNGYQIYWSSGRPRAELRANGIRYVTAPGDTLDKNLTLVVGVFDRSGNLDCYVNGALINSVDISTESSTDIQNTVTLKAGLANVFGNKYFPGVIYTTAIFNKILSSIEIAEIYNGGAGFDLLSDIGDYASSANLQGYWKNTGNTDADWVDLSGNGNDGTVNGSPGTIYLPEGLTAGKDILGVTLTNLNTGELITSADGYALIADAASLDITTNITLEAWVKPFTVAANQTAIGKNNAYALNITSGAKLQFQRWNGTTSGTVNSSANLSPNTWHHIAATYDGTTTKLYIDGVEDTSIGTLTGTIDGTATDVLMGALTSSTQNFSGYLDNVRVYDEVKTASNILNNYNVEKNNYI